MNKLKLLNRKYLSITLFFFLGLAAQSQEPVDIWKLEKEKKVEEVSIIKSVEEKSIQENTIYEMQSKKKDQFNIVEDQTLTSKEVTIIGLYDPEKNGLNINMWANSDGDQILNLIKNIEKINLSKDASEILNIILLTNAYYPNRNISKEQFLEIKSNWLIRDSNLKLIENYILNNQIINENPKLTKFLVNDYLSRSKIKNSCEVLSKVKKNIEDEYLSKFYIYCLINDNKKEEAQLLLDLKKESGFQDKFYEKKINYLMGYSNKPDNEISENTILDFHLSHRTNPDFKFEPNNLTSKKIWKYLSTSNLLSNVQDIEMTNIKKIKTIELATHEKNYTEKELFELYKRFQFNINQLLNIKESSKGLSAVEVRALIYQGILITTEPKKKIELMSALKNSFKQDGIEKAFTQELRDLLKEIDIDSLPSKHRVFYEKNIVEEITNLKNVKINNKILHQSKLVNYFNGDNSIKKITKELNDFLKKIKKNKKYFLSKKDIILIEALKSDEIKVSEKYKNLYKIDKSEIPSDIQIFINNGDIAAAMLRIVEVIGQDQLEDIDADTMYFIIHTLNKLNIDPIRNKILFKFLPLKV
jgi:hypothetical protein